MIQCEIALKKNYVKMVRKTKGKKKKKENSFDGIGEMSEGCLLKPLKAIIALATKAKYSHPLICRCMLQSCPPLLSTLQQYLFVYTFSFLFFVFGRNTQKFHLLEFSV